MTNYTAFICESSLYLATRPIFWNTVEVLVPDKEEIATLYRLQREGVRDSMKICAYFYRNSRIRPPFIQRTNNWFELSIKEG